MLSRLRFIQAAGKGDRPTTTAEFMVKAREHLERNTPARGHSTFFVSPSQCENLGLDPENMPRGVQVTRLLEC